MQMQAVQQYLNREGDVEDKSVTMILILYLLTSI